MKRVICILIFLFYPCATFAADKNRYFLSVSDIHFNPFYACKKNASHCLVIQKLSTQPVSQWKAILDKYDSRPQRYGDNTGYQLFSATIKELAKQKETKNISFILLLGDLLAHNYKEQYQQYTHDYSTAGAEKFVQKSMLFIVQRLNAVFPTTDIFPVIGNNDAYTSHYAYEPKFFTDIAKIWVQLIKSKANKKAFLKDFPRAGYYQVNLMDNKVKMIALNSTLFSPNTDTPHAISQEAMRWLDQQLKTLNAQQQSAFLATHIPASIDVFVSLASSDFVTLWRDEFLIALQEELTAYPRTIKLLFAGHLHSDWLQYLSIGDHEIAVVGIPGISPQFGNNPAFKIYQYDKNNFEIKDYQLIYADLTDHGQWKYGYAFQALYNATCPSCSLVHGIKQIKPSGQLADAYQFNYAILRDAQPITQQHKWHPYYWCAISNNLSSAYQKCLLEEGKNLS